MGKYLDILVQFRIFVELDQDEFIDDNKSRKFALYLEFLLWQLFIALDQQGA